MELMMPVMKINAINVYQIDLPLQEALKKPALSVTA
jgi:hypothetical protein